MIPQCPKCGTALKDDYGMVTCSGCDSIVFIDMEGGARIGEEESSSMAENEPGDFAPLTEFPFQEPHNQPEFEIPQAPEEVSEPLPENIHSGDPEEFNMDAMLGYNEEPAADPSGADHSTPGPDFGPESDPLGINEYANSEFSQGKDGLLLFRVLISGIDSKEIRESIREAIEDLRFAWDPGQIMATISKGSLTIDNLSPVKAAILVNRIKRLPIKIRWEQYAITQVDEFDNP